MQTNIYIYILIQPKDYLTELNALVFCFQAYLTTVIWTPLLLAKKKKKKKKNSVRFKTLHNKQPKTFDDG